MLKGSGVCDNPTFWGVASECMYPALRAYCARGTSNRVWPPGAAGSAVRAVSAVYTGGLSAGSTSDFADLWLKPRMGSFKAEHPHVLFCINGEGDAPLRIGQVDCEISFGPQRRHAYVDLLFRDFVLPIGTPAITHRISDIALRERLEGFPLLQLDFYKEDPGAPNWAGWIKAQRLKRTEPNRGIRFQRIKPALEAVRANAGLTICGLALLSPYIDDGTLSLPFPLSTGQWTDHAFQAHFRQDALLRPQVKRFRQWLVSQAATTRDWLLQHVQSAKPPHRRRRTTGRRDAGRMGAVRD